MGSADIYAALEGIPAIADALVIGAEQDDGSYWMPLFVTLADGRELDEALIGQINASIREFASPRHVPDQVIAVSGIPHTRTGKKLEVPVKRLLQGVPLARVVNPSVMDNPELLAEYAAIAADRR
jgi:acetoacetyl-CoA synthetase